MDFLFMSYRAYLGKGTVNLTDIYPFRETYVDLSIANGIRVNRTTIYYIMIQ